MTTKEVNGFYGISRHNPCVVFVAENRNGSKWYVVEGGTIVNKTYNDIELGVDVETIEDIDCFTNDTPIRSIEELAEAIEN